MSPTRLNTPEYAKMVFGPGKETPELTYQGATITADFPLTYDALAPYCVEVLDQAARIESWGDNVELIEIQKGVVKVWGPEAHG